MPVKILAGTEEAYTYPLLIKQLLRTPLQNAAEEEIVYRDRVRYNYRTLDERIARLANTLATLGVQQGDTVAMMDWDSHRYLECYFAVPMMGAVLQTVNVRLAPDQIEYTLMHSAATCIVVNREFAPVLELMLTRLNQVRAVIVIDDENTAPSTIAFAGEYEELLAIASPHYDFPDFDENAIATTFYTTGTTGLPKGVCFSHRQLVLHTLAVMGALASAPGGQNFRQGDVYMPITPMFHVHAWGIPYVATVLGVKQVYPGRYEPHFLVELRRREGVTYSHCVPTILQMLLQAADASRTDLRGWKMTIGGAALSQGLLRQALDRGMDVFAGYGMSETGPILTITRLLDCASVDEELLLRCKSGRAIPLVQVRIVDEAMRDVPHDGQATGEVVVRAPWLTQLYIGDEEASRGLWRHGYLHTQDIACVDAKGYVQITDRLKDVIKTGGEWISSLALEDLISRHPGVAEAAVVGVPHERWGERPIAFVVPKAGVDTATLPEQIRALMTEHAAAGIISRFAIPERVFVVPSLARTSVGKINKKAMREQAV
jgi:fatty-acyl-CoA synthase